MVDDAHLMAMDNLRRLRLLFEDFPKNHNLILVGQPVLLSNLDLAVNQDIKKAGNKSSPPPSFNRQPQAYANETHAYACG